MNTATTTPTPQDARPVRIALVDNEDSFVYNLVDAFAVAGYDCTVFRNSVDPEVIFATDPDLIVLSPGPGHPTEAGNMMTILDRALDRIPVLGICLGFQALLEHHHGTVRAVGPVHGISDTMLLTDEGIASGLFDGLTVDAGPDLPGKVGRRVPVARYHSLGCTDLPQGLVGFGTCTSQAGEVTMAAATTNGTALGLQFHPESVLTPSGPHIITRCVDYLLHS
ncbi:anthranilate synthase component II [Corynebacterium sp. 13CS0277]|uniref:anthranilate synthase component II n=1 Tax=Corynebacterium sp. 13CS0277 TaxID=2071994 RepID=UPI000D0390CB|nr:anthranilate synthase component II [Corynebacterium sp. 13CS0277]PRQ11076.1 anthranilate synthase component II [Corynebacterium sp. 13CS0277]